MSYMNQINFKFVINYFLKFAMRMLLNLTYNIYKFWRQKQSIGKSNAILLSIAKSIAILLLQKCRYWYCRPAYKPLRTMSLANINSSVDKSDLARVWYKYINAWIRNMIGF